MSHTQPRLLTSYEPQPVSKPREEAEVTLSSESDSDSYYDSAKARDPTPPNSHIGTATTQIVHSVEACYIAPVGHFHKEHEVPKRVEIQHRRYFYLNLSFGYEISLTSDS
jgi:hypothetical protein